MLGMTIMMLAACNTKSCLSTHLIRNRRHTFEAIKENIVFMSFIVEKRSRCFNANLKYSEGNIFKLKSHEYV